MLLALLMAKPTDLLQMKRTFTLCLSQGEVMSLYLLVLVVDPFKYKFKSLIFFQSIEV